MDNLMKAVNIIIVLVIIFLIYKILRGTGLVKTASEKEVSDLNETIYQFKPLDPLFWKTVKGANLIKTETVKNMISDLRNAMSGIGTDEAKIYSVFNKIVSRSQASYLAWFYETTYKASLVDDLVSELSNNELNVIYNKIKNLKDVV